MIGRCLFALVLALGCEDPAAERAPDRAVLEDAEEDAGLASDDEPRHTAPPRAQIEAPHVELVPEGLRSLEPEACGACHRAELRDWRASGHARAFTEPMFEREWSLRRSPWCSSCHAPRTRGVDPREPAFAERAELGVDCASCHVRGGAVVGSRVSGRAPHASHADASFGASAACAGCHEFAHPRQPQLMVQSTLTEHAASDASDVACQRCHMPRRGPHLFPGARDARLRRSAVEVDADAVREGDGVRLTLRMRASGAGHAVPTGDLARRLELSARIGAAVRTLELGRSIRVDGRRFVELDDTRIPARGEREVTMLLPGSGSHVRWRLDLLTLPFDAGGRGDPGDREELDDDSLRHPMISGRARVRDAIPSDEP